MLRRCQQLNVPFFPLAVNVARKMALSSSKTAASAMTTASFFSSAASACLFASSMNCSSTAAAAPAAVAASSSSSSSSEIPSTFIFNPFNGRLMPRTSPIFDQLRQLGIATSSPSNTSLAVSDRDLLLKFASLVRANPEVNMPALWSKRMRQTLGGLLLQETEDVCELVDAYFKRCAMDRLYARDIRVVIGSVGAGDGNKELDEREQQVRESAVKHGTMIAGEKVVLTPEQERVVQFALRGYNLYLGGDAGTGKTVTITEMVRRLRQEKLRVAVTASTGLAACHLGGATFHSFCGIGKANDFLQAAKNMPIVDVIVIDEISMLSGGLMHRFDQFLRAERNNDEPFGGTQIILCGDFLQLNFILSGEQAFDRLSRKNVFEIDVFQTSFVCMKLVQQVRQADHLRFTEQLRELRIGKVPEDLFAGSGGHVTNLDVVAKEQGLSRGTDIPVPEGTIRLLPTNKQAIEANAARLAQLPGEEVRFIPCATPPTLTGKWTTTAVIEVPPDSFDVAKFRTVLYNFLRNRAEEDSQALAASGRAAAGGFQHDIQWYLPESSVVAYLTHPDGCVARLMLPSSKEEMAARLSKLWDNTMSSMASLAQSCCNRNAAPMMMNDGCGGIPADPNNSDNAASASPDSAASATATAMTATTAANRVITKCSVIDVLPNGDALHTNAIEEELNNEMKRHPVAQGLPLKIGAQVLLRVNISHVLVNGSVGTVVGFVPATLENLPGIVRSNRHMAAALQAYVDHSRASLGTDEAPPVLPVVRFRGVNDDLPIPPWPFAVGGDVSTNYYAMDVISIPLTLAYAFTTHKVQGLTLLADVRIELEQLWDDCEHIIYVAMSRVKDPRQLSITGFKEEMVQTNKAAVKFDLSLVSVSKCEDPDEKAAHEQQQQTSNAGADSSLNQHQQQQQQQDVGSNNNNINSNGSSGRSFGFYKALWMRFRNGDFMASGGMRLRGSTTTGPVLPKSALRHFKHVEQSMKDGSLFLSSASKKARPGASFSDIASKNSGLPKWLRERMASTPTAPSATMAIAAADTATCPPAVAANDEKSKPASDSATTSPSSSSASKSSPSLAAVVSDKKKTKTISAAESKRAPPPSKKPSRSSSSAAAAADEDITPPLFLSKKKDGKDRSSSSSKLGKLQPKLDAKAEKKSDKSSASSSTKPVKKDRK